MSGFYAFLQHEKFNLIVGGHQPRGRWFESSRGCFRPHDIPV